MTARASLDWGLLISQVIAALMRRGRSSQDAQDLAQEAWLRLAFYELEHEVREPAAFVMRAALNLSIDAHRMRTRHGEEVLVEDVVLVDLAPHLEDQILAKERVERLGFCLGRLSPKTREIFLAHRLDGLTYREIARQRGLSVSSVEGHVSKAILQISAWMDGY